MNRKEAIAVTAVILATFVGGAFADTVSTNSTRTTVQTTSVDLEVLKIVPGVSFTPFSSSSGFTSVTMGIPVGNVTSAFSFAPNKGFLQVNSILATIVWGFGGGSVNGFTIQLNHLVKTNVTGFGSSIGVGTVVGALPASGLNTGTNLLTIGVIGTNFPFAFVYEVRLTVEYTFLN